MKIYFAGSIRGGRESVLLYKYIIEQLEDYGDVLDKHIGDVNLSAWGEKDLDDASIKTRDQAWINEADVMIAEISQPSHGVGFEIGLAQHLDKPILALFREQTGRRPSPMIAGSPRISVKHYRNESDIGLYLDQFFTELSRSNSSKSSL
jgi:nucleoside 2-deoxyribosyltransferase